jgi:hypothetical protein
MACKDCFVIFCCIFFLVFIQVPLGFLSTGNSPALPAAECAGYSRGITGDVG